MIATSHNSGFFGCKIDLEKARKEAQVVLGASQQKPTANSPSSGSAFSPSSLMLSPQFKKVLENAELVSVKML